LERLWARAFAYDLITKRQLLEDITRTVFDLTENASIRSHTLQWTSIPLCIITDAS
jgi:hypothetical protein